METRKRKLLYFVGGLVITGVIVWTGRQFLFSSGTAAEAEAVKSTGTVSGIITPHKPKYVRGIHLTSWIAGSLKHRKDLDEMLRDTELNTVVIDVKEYEGEVYLPSEAAVKYKSYVPAIPDAGKYIAELKSKGIYPVARIVVFKDNVIPRHKPEWGVKNADGSLWKDRRGITWTDPYNKAVWDYNIALAEKAVDMGFEEIQFDYIRFPSDGNIKTCRYSEVHSSTTAPAALVGFLKEANRRLKAKGANISIDVFGLTTTVAHDMGIGQKIVEMTRQVDFVSPMVYPSHYAKGEYRIPDPNKQPYKTVYLGMEGAKRKLGPEALAKLRPYYQDFSMGYHYGPAEVRAQIQAGYDNDVAEWLLWNAACRYTRGALKTKEFTDKYEKKDPPADMFPPKKEKTEKVQAAAKKEEKAAEAQADPDKSLKTASEATPAAEQAPAQEPKK